MATERIHQQATIIMQQMTERSVTEESFHKEEFLALDTKPEDFYRYNETEFSRQLGTTNSRIAA